MVERRQYPRHKLQGECFVRYNTMVGGIIDLSLGGVACSCFHPTTEDGHLPACHNIDIFCADDKSFVQELDISVVDSEIIPGKFLADFWVIKCRARFANLRDEQRAQLAELIRTHSTAPPSPLQ